MGRRAGGLANPLVAKKTKAQILAHLNAVAPTPKYEVQAIAEKFSTDGFEIKILFLPVAHPGLNLIEMI